MAITIHQRVHLYLWHWKTGPGWVRSPSEMHKLRAAGARVLKVQLQDDGPIPRELCDEWRAAGFKVWGMVRPSLEPLGGAYWNPWEAATWLKQERVRLALAGLDFNGEADVLKADTETGGEWSLTMATQWRNLHPTQGLHFDSYWGPMGGGINLGAWKAHEARFWVQTFWGAEGLWDDPPTNIVQKGQGAQPLIPKAIIKPIFRVTANNSGQVPNWDVVFADTQQAGTKGCGLYYIDGADFDRVEWLTREAIRRGIAY